MLKILKEDSDLFVHVETPLLLIDPSSSFPAVQCHEVNLLLTSSYSCIDDFGSTLVVPALLLGVRFHIASINVQDRRGT